MKLLIKIAAVMFAVIVLVLPVYGQMGGGMMGGKDMMGGGMIGGDMMRGIAKDMMNRGHEMRNQQGMTGMGFMHSEGNNFGNDF